MIYDRIENIDLYNLDKTAVDFIKKLTPDIECKKYILNENIYVNVEEYQTKDVGYFEAHKNYLDIQILLKGEEIIEYTSLKDLVVKEDYDVSRDIAFYYDGNNFVLPLKLQEGVFTVLYPHDAHKPQLKFNDIEKVKKVVVKVRV